MSIDETTNPLPELDFSNMPLGRAISPDLEHVNKYPYMADAIVQNVELELPLPVWHTEWDQGSEGACVGFGSQMGQAIVDGERFDPWWLWNEAKKIDIWPDTNPGDNNGTSVRAAMDVLRTQGNKLNGSDVIDKKYGISENRWATTVGEIRTVISTKTPVTIGVNWYVNFDKPQLINGEYWIGLGDLEWIRGGHAVCVFGASDSRGAVKIKNSWPGYPEVYMPYSVLQRLLNERGEATMITDRTAAPIDKYIFRKQLRYGMKDKEILELQKHLNKIGFTVSRYGAGSVGNETENFGINTLAAVQRFQLARGIVKKGQPGYGEVGVKTRAELNK